VWDLQHKNAHGLLDLWHRVRQSDSATVFDISDSDTATYYRRFPLEDVRGTRPLKPNGQKQNNFREARLGIANRNTLISITCVTPFVFYEQILDPPAMSRRCLNEWNVLLALSDRPT
jgi:hypothetical protein